MPFFNIFHDAKLQLIALKGSDIKYIQSVEHENSEQEPELSGNTYIELYQGDAFCVVEPFDKVIESVSSNLGELLDFDGD